MGNPIERGVSHDSGMITCFYGSNAWVEGRAEDQLQHVTTWKGVQKIAAFPDLHPGKYGPVGCAVVADRIYPQLIGNDIGCGMSVFQLDLPLRKLKLDKAAKRLRVLGEPLQSPPSARLEQLGLPGDLHANALGTIGGGNHFCEVQKLADCEHSLGLDPDSACLLVHSGSRGFGSSILHAQGNLPRDGVMGDHAEAYCAAHDQAVLWASLNRRIIAERAAEALRCDVRQIADVPHNLLSRSGTGFLHRKGAARAGGVIPIAGSRATPSYLVEALGHPAALGSLAHGAGRKYDRASMHGRVRSKKSDLSAMERTAFGGRVICEDRDMLIEEAPQAYKSAEHVLRDLMKLGVVKRVGMLTPLLTFKKTREGAQ